MLIAFVVPAVVYPRGRERCRDAFGAGAAVTRALFVPERLATPRVTLGVVLFGGVMAAITLFDMVVANLSADGEDPYL